MKIKKIIATGLATMVIASCAIVPNTYADSVPVVTIGADLTQEQKDKIMSFFGVSSNSVEVVEITNAQEREYLEGLIPDEVIGTRTLSCSYILPMSSGGIMIKTANLTWVSEGMLANALLTSGIENCQVLATAPFAVSGTGALTGVMTAYEQSSGETLDSSKKELATEELIVTGEIVDEVVKNTSTEQQSEGVQKITEAQLLELLNDIKSEVINGKLTEERVKEIVQGNLEEYRISLTEDTYNKLVNYLTSLSQTDYAKSFKKSLDSLTDRINKGFDININLGIDIDFKTDKNSIEQFWINVWNWLRYIFGGMVEDAKENINIFETINTDIIQYDEPVVSDNPDSELSSDSDNSSDMNINTDEPIVDNETSMVETGEMNDSIETVITESSEIIDNIEISDNAEEEVVNNE